MQIQSPVFELHINPHRPLLKTTCEGQPLFVGDTVKVRFSQTAPHQLDRTGTIAEQFRFDRYRVECVSDDGVTDDYSVPRDLLILVRRGDA